MSDIDIFFRRENTSEYFPKDISLRFFDVKTYEKIAILIAKKIEKNNLINKSLSCHNETEGKR